VCLEATDGEEEEVRGARRRGGQGQEAVEDFFFLLGIERGSGVVRGEQTERSVGFLGWTHMSARAYGRRRRCCAISCFYKE
jgi:hypothetical protein